MQIHLFALSFSDTISKCIEEVYCACKDYGIDVTTHIYSQSEKAATEADIIISIGGDGTLLKASHLYNSKKILGINAGKLGFMADVPAHLIRKSIQHIANDEYTIETRPMLKATVDGKELIALNDIVFHRAHNKSIIELAVHYNNTYVNTIEADGLIVATPCGSTAYSLSAGGPIVSLNVEALIVTPISPHTISNRPLLLSNKHELTITPTTTYQAIELIADGIETLSLEKGTKVSILSSELKCNFIILPESDYFFTLRTKLGWEGTRRSKRESH